MWPFKSKQVETRSFQSDVLDAVFQSATTRAADAGKSAGVEAAAGYVSRSLAAAKVSGDAGGLVTPMVLSQIGRSLIRRGASLWVDDGTHLTEAGHWHFEVGNNGDRRDWMCRVSDYGPHGTRTRLLSYDRILFLQWGHPPEVPFTASGPLQFASITAAAASNSEQAIAHESATPVSNLVEVPADGWSDVELAEAKKSIMNAKGRLFFTDVLKVGDKAIEPDSSWRQRHIGPMPDSTLAQVATDSFNRVLAACGLSPSLFEGGSNSQGQRESARRAHLNLILPVTKMVEHELKMKLSDSISIEHDHYFSDMVGRSQVVSKLVTAGVSLEIAMSAVGLNE